MEPLRFAILGLGAGGLYAAVALGVVLVYRSSGVLNFAQGAIGMVGAMFFFELRDDNGMPWELALPIAIGISATIGLLVQLLVMYPLRTASPLVRVITTLGLLIFLLYAGDYRWGSDLEIVRGVLPDDVVNPVSTLEISVDRLWLVAGAVVLTAVAAVVYGRTRFGLKTSAVAEDPYATASMGHSPNLIAAVNWAVGGALAAGAAVFSAPITGKEVTQLSLLIIPALAAALVGRFRSFGWTLVGALGIGVAESLVGRYASDVVGLADSIPLMVIVLVLVVRWSAL